VFCFVSYDTSGTHLLRYSETMKLILDSEAKTEQKCAIWCSCYLCICVQDKIKL